MASKATYYWDACIFYEWLGKEPVSVAKKDGLQEILDGNEREEMNFTPAVFAKDTIAQDDRILTDDGPRPTRRDDG